MDGVEGNGGRCLKWAGVGGAGAIEESQIKLVKWGG